MDVVAMNAVDAKYDTDQHTIKRSDYDDLEIQAIHDDFKRPPY